QGDHPEVHKLAGMMVGVYTGGTPNLMAIGKALAVSEEAFIMINAVAVVLGGVYLLFVMAFGVKLMGKILPPPMVMHDQEMEADLIHWRGLSLGKKFKHSIILLLLAALAVGAAVILSRLITGGESVGVIILGLTSVALALSFVKKIRHF